MAAIVAVLVAGGYITVSYTCSADSHPVDGGTLAKLIIGTVGAFSAADFLWLIIRHSKDDFGILAERLWTLLLASVFILAFAGWNVVETAKPPIALARACAVETIRP